MSEFESLSLGWDHLGNIARTLGDLQGAQTAIYELIQNADDAPGATRMRFVVTHEALEVWNDGIFERCGDVSSADCEWLLTRGYRCDFHSFRKMASGDKRNRPGTTGAFGLGFTAVYQFTDRPELMSNGEHWLIDHLASEQDRVTRSTAPVQHDGTTFRMPWATERTAFREAIRQEPVSPETVTSFIDELRSAIPGAMPFLKKLRVIEASEGKQTATFKRSPARNHVGVRLNGGALHEWLVLEGDFADAAAKLKTAHPDVIEESRSPDVRVALPVSEHSPRGLLYATLPTEEPAHLPLLINADFVPASDRKRIRFDASPVSEWNRCALRTAASVLANNLEPIAAAIGDEAFVQLLIAGRELRERLEDERIEQTYAAFWEAITEHLPAARVVPVETGGHGNPGTVRLWAEEAELAAAPVLNDLGVPLVARHVRASWYRLRGSDVGIRNLHLTDLNGALLAKGMTRRWVLSERSDALAQEDGLRALWALTDALLEIRDRSTEQARAQFLKSAVAPGRDGAIWPIEALYSIDPATQDLLADIGVRATFLDSEALADQGLRLADLVSVGAPSTVLAWAEQAFNDYERSIEDPDRDRLLRWFFERRNALDSGEESRLAALPIFPTAAGRRPLVGLAIPGDFTDELGLAQVLSVERIEEMGPFLRQLGARPLTVAVYCTDYVPDAVAQGDIDERRREQLLELLAIRLSEIRDDAGVRAALQPLDLVICTDREWRPGTEVYLNGAVCKIVGSAVPIARIPVERKTAYQELYRWLGASDEPRPQDVVGRCYQLRSAPKDHRAVTEAIVSYVGGQFARDQAAVAAAYAELRNIPWLPADKDRSRGQLPRALSMTFRKSLFASQSQFLDISRRVEQENGPFLQWLGLAMNPDPKQVVDHLLWSASRSEPVGMDVWAFLDQHANDPSLDALRNQSCLLIAESDRYVRPSEVYWREHPFGRFRYQLGPNFAQYQSLLERLDVAEQPHPGDAVEVLQDVAAQHNGEHAPLLGQDIPVVQACWALLTEGLESGVLDNTHLGDLEYTEAVLDSLHWLRMPREVFFRDSLTLAQRFGPAVQKRLIDRPEGMWKALSAAGVRNLSGAVDTTILEQEEGPPGGVVASRLKSRRRLILRVLAEGDVGAAEKLADFEDNVRLQRLSRLVIQQAVDVEDDLHLSDPYERGALFMADQGALLYVEADGDEPVWVELAWEIARALDVDGSQASGVAAAIKGLLAAMSDEAAQHELDELGFPALDETLIERAEPGVASGLGGAPASGGDIVDKFGSTEVPADQVHQDELAPAAADIAPLVQPVGHSKDSDEPATPLGTRDVADGDLAPRDSSTEAGASTDHASTRGRERPMAQTRLRSYVAPVEKGDHSATDAADDADPAVERAAVEAVMEFERSYDRDPEEMPKNNPGFDIRSVDPDGRVRVIEVKGTAVEWGLRGVPISSTQFAAAQQRREEFWLYVVDRALTAPRVHPINDPASKIDQYFFDDRWRMVAEKDLDEQKPLAGLHLPTSPEDVEGAVPVVDPEDATHSPAGWIACHATERQNTWFAVRIAGDALGLAYRGGLAFVEPIDRAVDDDELVVVILHDQVDPDTGRPATIRLWRPERDLAGNRLALRLWSSGSVEPLTVKHPDKIDVRGVVRRQLRASDLEALGYC